MAVRLKKFKSVKGKGANFHLYVTGVDDYKRVLGKLKQKRTLSRICRQSLDASGQRTVSAIQGKTPVSKNGGALKKSIGYKTKAYPKSGNGVMLFGSVAQKRISARRTPSNPHGKKWVGGWQPNKRAKGEQGGYFKKMEKKDKFTLEGVKDSATNISRIYGRVFQTKYLQWQAKVTNKARIAKAKRQQQKAKK